MTARDRSAAAIVAAPGSVDFDDVGAFVAAMRHMLDGALPPSAGDARHLYNLACAAEAAWQRLDDAMQPEAGK